MPAYLSNVQIMRRNPSWTAPYTAIRHIGGRERRADCCKREINAVTLHSLKWNAMKRTVLIILVSLLASTTVTMAQKMDKDHLNFSVSASGNHMLNALHIYENLIDSYDFASVSATVGVNTFPSDSNYFAWACNLPRYGLGLSYSGMGGIDCKPGSRLGDAYSFFGYGHIDVVRTGIFSFGPSLHFGLSGMTRRWNAETNPMNLYVGTPVLVMIGVGLEASFQLTPKWELGLTSMIMHRSNGMLKVPNYGLNDLSIGLFTRYNINERYCGHRGEKPQVPSYKKWIYDIYFSGGVHSCDPERHIYEDIVLQEGDQNRWKDSKSWLRLNLGGTVSYRYHPLFATGVGLDVSYTGNWKRLAEYYELKYGEKTTTCPVYVGAYLQQSFFYKNVEIAVGLGVYLFKKLGVEDSTWNYQRALIRYHIPKAGNIFFGFAMRAHRFDRSDTLEFSFGKSF